MITQNIEFKRHLNFKSLPEYDSWYILKPLSLLWLLYTYIFSNLNAIQGKLSNEREANRKKNRLRFKIKMNCSNGYCLDTLLSFKSRHLNAWINYELNSVHSIVFFFLLLLNRHFSCFGREENMNYEPRQ